MLISLPEAFELLKKGHVIGIPTDTVYGFAALPQFAQKIYELKKRDPQKKLINFIDNFEKIGLVDDFTNEELKIVAAKYWPGNYTLLFQQKGVWESYRIPKEMNVCRLLKQIDGSLSTTSANISGDDPVLTSSEFEQRFSDIPLLVQEQKVRCTGTPSSIIKMSKNQVEIIRE